MGSCHCCSCCWLADLHYFIHVVLLVTTKKGKLGLTQTFTSLMIFNRIQSRPFRESKIQRRLTITQPMMFQKNKLHVQKASWT